jgi:Diacylglycerol kinase catalytic domain
MSVMLQAAHWGAGYNMVAVALLTNPDSTGNRNSLAAIRSFCAKRSDIFHYEVERSDQIADALAAIAMVSPQILVLNGGDGTVQAALTELHLGDHFKGEVPPVAVLASGKTNLIAIDLGTVGNPLDELKRIVALSKTGFSKHLVKRELISLTEGEHGNRPVLGMFLGGAGLADTILYCRNKIYPLGLPNGLSHVIACIAVFFGLISGLTARFLPPKPFPVRVSFARDGQLKGNFAFLIVTTLEKMVFGAEAKGIKGMKLMAVERSTWTLLKSLFAGITGTLGIKPVEGLHFQNGDEIRIESERASVILDGEEFRATTDRPIVLRSTPPMNFLRLAA